MFSFINHNSPAGMLSPAFCPRVNTFFHILRDRDIIFRRVNRLGVTMERKLRPLPRLTQARRTQGHRVTLVDSLRALLEVLRRRFCPCPAMAV
jgi:hypothetical protein